MKLIFGVDAISPPLTGIGRYAFEIAKYLEQQRDLESLRYYFNGIWLQDPFTFLNIDSEKSSNKPRASFSRLPKIFRKAHTHWSNRAFKTHLFHSPNYFLPAGVEGGVITVHDLSIFRFPATHPAERIRHFEKNFADSLKRAQHLITDTEAIRREVASFFSWPLNRITAIHLGVSPVFHPRGQDDTCRTLSSYGLVHGKYNLCVSTLEPRKRIDDVLSAYGTLDNDLRCRFPLVLVGSSGWLNDDLLKSIDKGKHEGWLIHLGYVPEDRLPELYSGARAFIFPSLYEGFGLPVLEALASGIPTVTSDCSSLPEVAGGAALLVTPGDISGIASAITRAATDDDWRVMARAKGLVVAANHTWKECAHSTLSVYRDLAD